MMDPHTVKEGLDLITGGFHTPVKPPVIVQPHSYSIWLYLGVGPKRLAGPELS